MGRVRGKLQAAGSQCPEAPKSKDTNSPIPNGEILANYPENLHQLCKKYDPRYEKFEKIKELERLLKGNTVDQEFQGCKSDLECQVKTKAVYHRLVEKK